MFGPKKCANATCTCIAPAKKKYCSDHCEAIGNKLEIICLCGHADCGITAIQSAQQEGGTRTSAGGPAAPR
jgi:hypothetical protein